MKVTESSKKKKSKIKLIRRRNRYKVNLFALCIVYIKFFKVFFPAYSNKWEIVCFIRNPTKDFSKIIFKIVFPKIKK